MFAKYFIGPMSKNIVEVIINFCNENDLYMGLIPSRRQIEWNGGYVNNWSTEEFSRFVRSKTNKIILVRDHAGPNQGLNPDSGYKSLEEDCKYFDVIHIDPWKKIADFDFGVSETISMINFCYERNKNINFEVGTEESIRRFETHELEEFIKELESKLQPKVFGQIKYLVVQSGTSLKGINQTGIYDPRRLEDSLEICKKNNLISKEHNGDYLPISLIEEKFKVGLETINIAPELGVIETQTYIDMMVDEKLINKFWKICYDSGKWIKWVDPDFDPNENKTDTIKICGHYVFSHPDFIEIKNRIHGIDQEIKKRIKSKLEDLHGI